MIFREPIYAVIGGLHFPVNGGRIFAGPMNVKLNEDTGFQFGINDVISKVIMI